MHKKPRIYLAVPYTHSEKFWMDLRFQIVTYLTAQLHDAGFLVYSPITSSHPLLKYMKTEGAAIKYDVWKNLDRSMIDTWADMLVMLKLPGHKESIGLKDEVKYSCDKRKIQVEITLEDVYYGKAIDHINNVWDWA